MRFTALVLTLSGCTFNIDAGSDKGTNHTDSRNPDTGNDSGVTDTGGTDSGTLSVVGPCGDGGWNGLDEFAIHVSISGDDTTGDGSVENPFGTIGAGIGMSRINGNRDILVWPGNYNENITLESSLGDDGLQLRGCGSNQTWLSGNDSSLATVHWYYTTGAELEGFTIEGGTNGIKTTTASLDIEDVNVVGSSESGINLYASSVVTLTDIQVGDTDHYGVLVWQGSSVDILSITIEKATSCGILADQADLMATDVLIEGMVGVPAIGICTQGYSTLDLNSVTVNGGNTAGIVTVDSFVVTITDAEINGVGDGTNPWADGVLVIQNNHENPATYSATLENIDVQGASRAAIIVDSVTVQTLQGNVYATGYNVGGVGIFTQGDTIVTDPSADPYVDLPEGSELPVIY